ncbi:MAG: PD-(D/E)XK nuclease family protein [Flavobacteriales bacterium]|jgi:CRISPR/Cas system-associated exonuclease Cas4 (RecB family)|nr:PD-(D/E)XK nuclease family protein [Flavobacteriales bacterium]
MTTFLKQIADDLIEHYTTEEFRNILLIVPSKRVGLHLKKELSIRLKKTFWSPQIKSIDEFLVEKHPLGVIDNISIHFELYQAYANLFESEETFDSFQSWSSQIINDFNEIDRYLLDHKAVFSNLKDIKEIEQWSFNSTELSENQSKFLVFWEKLGELYENFTNQLQAKQLATSARIYREIASQPQKYLNELPYQKIYIIGFNALSKSEEEIFKYLYQTSKAKLFWDTDQYYLNNKLYEAGHFIRNYKWATESIKSSAGNTISTQAKNINIYPAKTAIDQVNIAAKIMEKDVAFRQEKSALILSDEHLLNPLVNTIPVGLDQMNITMGYALSNTLAQELLDTCLEVIINNQRFNKSNAKSIYFKDLIKLFENALFKQLTSEKTLTFSRFKREVIQYNYSFITLKNLRDYFGDFHQVLTFLFFDRNKTITTVLDELITFIQSVRQQLISVDELNIEIEALYRIEKVLNKVKGLLNTYPFITTLSGLRKIIRQVLNKEKLSFYGEPLQGLQVMGFLETRALDFENVILLSCNESFLPGVAPSNSLIPFDLKLYFNLPTKSDREAIFAYYFYRVIQKAKNIHLVYNNGIANGIDSNEISRYLIQVENELNDFENINIQTHHINYLFNTKSKDKAVEKDSTTLHKLDLFFKNGISPSALNNYIACSLDFYYAYVLRIKEQEEVEESIENSTLGTITHQVLENLYTDLGPIIKVETIDTMLQLFEAETHKIFQEKFPQGNYKKGKNLLIFSMVLKSIKQFLLNEKRFIQQHGFIKILGLEQDLRHTLTITTTDGEKEVLLKGNADRIDIINNTIRVIDYKTGFIEQKNVSKQFDSLLTHQDSSKANQLMFYAYLYYKNFGKTNLTSGIFSLRNLNAGLLELKLKDGRTSLDFDTEIFDAYEKHLVEKIREIYDTSIPFTHNIDAKYCMIC